MDYLEHNRCLTVALEIASNQQSVINLVMKNEANVSEIKIPSIIDHIAFRKMLNNLVALKQKGVCLKLLAIDAGDDIYMGREHGWP